MSHTPEFPAQEKLLPEMSRRTALKVLGGSAVMVATPALAGSSIANVLLPADAEASSTVQPVAGVELSMQLTLEPEPLLTMTNNSDHLVIVRHVYPGIVHAGDSSFDINAVFERSAYAISAGASRRVRISPVSHTTAEAKYPRSRFRHQPQRIVSVTGFDRRGPLVNSTRSFYA